MSTDGASRDSNFESQLESIPLRLETFEGPLDLLLHLIKKHEVNIYDIPIALITSQYLDTLKAKTTVRVMLDPPRQKVAMVSSSPTRGPAGAPVEVVEFSDFQ